MRKPLLLLFLLFSLGVNAQDSVKMSDKRVNFFISVPTVNHLYFQPQGERDKSKYGIGWISGGATYCYKENRFLSLSISFVLALPDLIPVEYAHNSSYEGLTAINWSLTDNRKFKVTSKIKGLSIIKGFSVGYGLNFARNSWVHHDSIITKSKENFSFGLNLNGYVPIYKYLSVGLVYRPSIFRISPTPVFLYEHQLSIESVFNIPHRKRR